METVNVCEGHEAASRATAAAMALGIAGAVAERGVAHVALSGGGTPRRAYELLADPDGPFRARIAWPRVHVWWGDERNVPPDSRDSNYRMAREAMLARVPLAENQVHRMRGELVATDAASQYEHEIARVFELRPGAMPVFDVQSLGIGNDGHTASLVPGSPALDERSRLVVANPIEGLRTLRITMTFPVLLASRLLVVLVTGAGKAAAMADIFRPGARAQVTPAVRLRDTPNRLWWIVDREAVAQLDRETHRVLTNDTP